MTMTKPTIYKTKKAYHLHRQHTSNDWIARAHGGERASKRTPSQSEMVSYVDRLLDYGGSASVVFYWTRDERDGWGVDGIFASADYNPYRIASTPRNNLAKAQSGDNSEPTTYDGKKLYHLYLDRERRGWVLIAHVGEKPSYTNPRGKEAYSRAKELLREGGPASAVLIWGHDEDAGHFVDNIYTSRDYSRIGGMELAKPAKNERVHF